MSIEIKQLIIKSTLVNSPMRSDIVAENDIDVEQLKEQLINECKEIITESLIKLQER